MSIELWLAFVGASIVMLLIPGPTILTVISYSLAHGRRAYLPLIAAVALGDSSALVLSLLGLGALLASSAAWFTAVKLVGGMYLIYLGTRMLMSAFRHDDTGGLSSLDTAAPSAKPTNVPGSRWTLFFNTWLVTALNPKGIVFFVAFLPQFVTVDAPVAPQLWVLSVTFVALAVLNASAYVLFAGTARSLLSSATAQRRFNLVGGTLLTSAGLWALTARRAA